MATITVNGARLAYVETARDPAYGRIRRTRSPGSPFRRC